MNCSLLTFTAATALVTGSLVPSVEASPLSASKGANLASEARAPIENVAICFYACWNGPGLVHQCGFHRRHGQGWHGRRGGDDRHGRGVDRDRRGDLSDGRGPQIDGVVPLSPHQSLRAGPPLRGAVFFGGTRPPVHGSPLGHVSSLSPRDRAGPGNLDRTIGGVSA